MSDLPEWLKVVALIVVVVAYIYLTLKETDHVEFR